VIVLLIIGGIIVRTKRFGFSTGITRAKRQFRPAVLLKTEREYGEAKGLNGETVTGVVAMKLTFGFKDGTTKTFPVDNKMRGRCAENDWGNLMYEGDKLLKFECKSGMIGKKMYVPAENSVFHRFNQK
jgi:hypothetical protein